MTEAGEMPGHYDVTIALRTYARALPDIQRQAAQSFAALQG